MLRLPSKAAAIVLAGVLSAMKPALALDEDPGKWGINLGIGSFNPQTDSKLTGRSGNYSAALGASWRPWRQLAAEIEYLGYSQDVDIPASMKPRPSLFTHWNDNATLSTTGYGGVLKLVQPLGPFDFYAGAGVGYYTSTLKVSAINTLTWKTSEISKSDRGYGTQLVVGADIHTARNHRLGVQYRRMVLNPSFGPEIGSTTAGGTMWQLTYRGFFGS